MDVLIKGFKTAKQAQEFIDWYEGGGEQTFDTHLDDVVKVLDGCYVDLKKKYVKEKDQITIFLK